MVKTNLTSFKKSTKVRKDEASKINKIMRNFDPDVYEAAQILMKLQFSWLKERVNSTTNPAHQHTATNSQLQPLLLGCNASNLSSSSSRNLHLSSQAAAKRTQITSSPVAGTVNARKRLKNDAPLLVSAKHQPDAEPPVIPKMFRDKIESMGGREIQYLMTKNLTDTDLNSDENRLLLPKSQMKIDFLTEGEEKVLSTRIKKNLMAVRIHLVEPDIKLDPSFINLKIWGRNYVLLTEWSKVVRRNDDLTLGEDVQIWCFRVGEDLGFALIRA